MFTDAACEDNGGLVTACGVLRCPNSDKLACLYYEVPKPIAMSWRSGESGQVIGQAELHPILVAKRTWAEQLRGTRAVFMVDNDSARDALFKGYSPIVSSCRILADSATADAELDITAWYERVPSCCNVADAPSRREFWALLAAGARQDSPCLPAEWATSMAKKTKRPRS